jgi:hypothetical protein
MLINKRIVSDCEVLFIGDRLIAVRLGTLLLCNAYMPCAGTPDRDVLFGELVSDNNFWSEKLPDCSCCLAGDFKVNMLGKGRVHDHFLDVIQGLGLLDDKLLVANFELFSRTRCPTYCNESAEC